MKHLLRMPGLSPLVLTMALTVSMLVTAPSYAQDQGGQGIHLGSGVKAGEITDTSAVILVRLTSSPGQIEQGLIPGRAGLVRLRCGADKELKAAPWTGWEAARVAEDYSVQFKLAQLQPARRHFYQAEFKTAADSEPKLSEIFSFVTAPRPSERRPVKFHLTTCQDYCGASTYVPMAAQRPDFCVSAGDTVYYDGQGSARTIPEAYQAYQKMFGLPQMKDFYRDVGGYFMKDDHDYRFNDSDPYMKGRWVSAKTKDPRVRLTERRGEQALDVAWLTHEEGIQVFRQVFPASEKSYRTFRWGQGLQIWLLENRDFRSPNDMPDGPDKSIWGQEQKAWLKETLLASDADFRVIISPNPIIGPDRLMKGDNHANLNGFWHEGQAFLDWLKDQKLDNVILMCGDRHWQYHSIDKRNGRNIPEFSCGPTCDEHIQAVPPLYEGVERPYSASRGGFLTVMYEPDRTLSCEFFSMEGKPLFRREFRAEKKD